MVNCQYELVAVSYLLRNDSLTRLDPKQDETEITHTYARMYMQLPAVAISHV